MMPNEVHALAEKLRSGTGIAAKADIAPVLHGLGLSGADAVAVGDDCAALPDGDGFLLFAIEGFINAFVAADPWFAGWCGAMVNISDIAAMGGRPTAIVNAIWAEGATHAAPILAGLRAASLAFGVPIVGGHTNMRCDRGQLSVAIIGRARALLSSFRARPGDRLMAAIDLRGRYRQDFDNWDAATAAPAGRLRGDIDILPRIAESGLCRAAKDISQGGLAGTAIMLAEASGVGLRIDLAAIPKPADVPLGRWLLTFPSFGYLLAVSPRHAGAVAAMFAARDIAAADIGVVCDGARVTIASGEAEQLIWDFSKRPLTGCGETADA